MKTVTDKHGQEVIQGKRHEPLEGERGFGQKQQDQAGVDMNPGEPAHPFEPFDQHGGTARKTKQPA